jgi:hypothetical protein
MRLGKSFHQCCLVITYDILDNKQILDMDNKYGYVGSQILVAPWLSGYALTQEPRWKPKLGGSLLLWRTFGSIFKI